MAQPSNSEAASRNSRSTDEERKRLVDRENLTKLRVLLLDRP
jgi:hypothetical protein